jgi:hypothetical protein
VLVGARQNGPRGGVYQQNETYHEQ